MQSMFLENEIGKEENTKLTHELILTVRKVLLEVSKDLLYFSVKFQQGYTNSDSSYQGNYSLYANNSKIKPQTQDLEFRTYIHAMSTFKLLEILLEAYCIADDAKALEILDLISFSHLLMKVPSAEFRFHNMEMIKFLQKYNVINEKNMKDVVICFNFVTNYICNFLDTRSSHCKLIEELTDVNFENKTCARRNFRKFKKWKYLVGEVRESIKGDVDSLIDCLPNDLEEGEVSTGRTNDALVQCFSVQSEKSKIWSNL